MRVAVEDVYAKGAHQYGAISAEFTAPQGTLLQRQRVTFIERGSK